MQDVLGSMAVDLARYAAPFFSRTRWAHLA